MSTKKQTAIAKHNMKRIYANDCPFSSDLVVDQNQHLMRFSGFLAFITLFVIIGCVVLAVCLAYVSSRPPETLTYAIDDKMRIVQIEPVSQPYSPAKIIGFSTETVVSALHLSFTDYKDHLLSISNKFTKKGFKGYQKQLVAKGWESKITEDNLTMWVEIKNAPKFLRASNKGAYEYDIEFDVDVFLGGGDKLYSPTRMTVVVTVIRTQDNLDGLKIKRLLMSETFK